MPAASPERQPSTAYKIEAHQRRHLNLDRLAAMKPAELECLYREAKAPTTLAELDGHPRGRMLGLIRAQSGKLKEAIGRLAGAEAFPWGGKSFSSKSPDEGQGVNRVRLFGRHELFHFHTFIGPSRIDGQPCVVLNYDLRDNPTTIARIYDEVREVAPGLYLGPAMWKKGLDASLVLWFGLNFEDQSEAVGAA